MGFLKPAVTKRSTVDCNFKSTGRKSGLASSSAPGTLSLVLQQAMNAQPSVRYWTAAARQGCFGLSRVPRSDGSRSFLSGESHKAFPRNDSIILGTLSLVRLLAMNAQPSVEYWTAAPGRVCFDLCRVPRSAFSRAVLPAESRQQGCPNLDFPDSFAQAVVRVAG